jgi:membrane-associated protease RseP (regulator of RpoE activity)
MNTLKNVFAIFVVVAVAACASPYERFYQSRSADTRSALPEGVEPRIIAGSSNPQQDIQQMFEDGYMLIGQSAFVGPEQNVRGAVKQARKVGAKVVVTYSKYRNTVTGTIPVMTPTTPNSYSSGTVNTFGSSGVGTGTYSGMTTTYGTQTQYVPYSIDKYDQGALYFTEAPRRGLGISVNSLTNEQRQAAATNQAVQVTAVRKGSPAFFADILPGDLMLSVDGKAVYDLASAHAAISASTGREVEVVLIRGTSKIAKKVMVPDTW